MKILKCLVMVAISATVLLGADSWATATEKNGSLRNGKLLYDKMRCYYCHKIGNVGGNTGPDLTKLGTKSKGIEWQIKNLTDAASKHPTKHADPRMPKFDKLTDKMFLDLATYLESLK